MGVRARQVLVAVLGAAVTVAMLVLGLWQMRVFEDRENESAQARAAMPALPLLEHVGADGSVGDVYGRQVTVTGTYLPDQQALVVGEDGVVRLVSALEVGDGRVLPVVRGTLPGPEATAPPPPAGELEQGGIFLPSEPGAEHATQDGVLGSVRLPLLAQAWPQQLLPGFVTLPAAVSAAQGLGAAEVVLPTGEGSVQNAGYALQWWVFAGFAAFMTVRFVQAIGRSGGLGTLSAQEEE